MLGRVDFMDEAEDVGWIAVKSLADTFPLLSVATLGGIGLAVSDIALDEAYVWDFLMFMDSDPDYMMLDIGYLALSSPGAELGVRKILRTGKLPPPPPPIEKGAKDPATEQQWKYAGALSNEKGFKSISDAMRAKWGRKKSKPTREQMSSLIYWLEYEA